MSKLQLTGAGAVYFRVSGDKQEVTRQTESHAAFEKRHGARVPSAHRYEDHMPRDMSAKRQDFQRMMKAVRAGSLQWIFVDHIDRFGFADEWELVEMLRDLRAAGCKLYDATDDEWTSAGLMSFFKAGLAGHASRDEQVKKSHRVLGGMLAKARNGEWLGAPPQLGFDVACYDRATFQEVWRVVWENRKEEGTEKRRGKERPKYKTFRRKDYPDGTSERLDGNVEFGVNKDTQIMRITPTKDKAKLNAVKSLFKRYAGESVSFTGLAKWLNDLGIRNACGKRYQGVHVERMLRDEAYLGYPTFNKRTRGRFKRYGGAKGVAEVAPALAGKEQRSDAADVIRCSTRLFDPIINRETWDAVQTKLAGYQKAPRSPRVFKMYLSGLVVCAGCGKPMNARGERNEYLCATWNRYRLEGNIAGSPCQSNPVKQSVLEAYITQYLEETEQRLELLAPPKDEHGLTDKLWAQEEDAWTTFRDGIARLTGYLAKHHPDEYAVIVREHSGAEEEGRPSPDDFVEAVVQCYRTNFNPGGLTAEIEQLEAEHTKMMKQWADLPTPRAKSKARDELTALEERIGELERQREDAADVVVAARREMQDLQRAIAEARLAMNGAEGEEALRRRAEVLRSILCRIECEFVLTTRPKKGRGNWTRSKLVGVSFVPIAGDPWSVSGASLPGESVSTAWRGSPWGRRRPRGCCPPRGA